MYKLLFILLYFNLFGENLTLSLVSDFPKDLKEFVMEPLSFDKKDYLVTFGLLSTSYLLINYDEKIKEFKDKHENENLDKFPPVFRKFGEFYPSLIFFTLGQLTNDDKAITTGIYSAEASLLGLGVTFIGKNIFTRARPYTGEGSDSWNNQRLNKDYTSFPSGHSTVSFATATVIANIYEDNKIIPPLVYTLASLSALSRVYDDKHWASDIFLGSAIGYFSGKLLLKIKDKKQSFLFPQSNGSDFGLTFGGQF